MSRARVVDCRVVECVVVGLCPELSASHRYVTTPSPSITKTARRATVSTP